MGLAAEFKRASPSKGDIAVDADIGEQATLYAEAGASVISILTETRHFKGSLDDLKKAREVTAARNPRPAILLKDFVVDERQVHLVG